MTSQPDDLRRGEELDLALRALPRAAAGADFQSTVLAQAKRAATRRGQVRRRWLSLAAGVCVVVAGLGAWRLDAAHDRAARRAALVDEHRRLQGELDELRALAEGRSLIHLGGDASTDLFLDLKTVPLGTAAQRPANPTRSHG